MQEEYAIGPQLKQLINQDDLSGAAEKLRDAMSAAESQHFDVYYNKKMRDCREGRKFQQQQVGQYQNMIQYTMGLLPFDEKEQFPNRILYKSFNIQYSPGQYIPGNFIHRQFAAYCKYFINKFYEAGRFEVFMDRTFDTRDTTVVTEFVQYFDQISKKYLQKFQNDPENHRLMKEARNNLKIAGEKFLKNIINAKDDPQQSQPYRNAGLEQFRKNIENKRCDVRYKSGIPRLCYKYKKQTKQYLSLLSKFNILNQDQINDLQKQINTRLQGIEKLFFDQCRDHTGISKLLQKRNNYEMTFKSQMDNGARTNYLNIRDINGYKNFYRQNNSQESHRREYLINNRLKEMQSQQFDKIRVKTINHQDTEFDSAVNYGLGRLSILREEGLTPKYEVLKPFVFSNQNLKSTDKEQSHCQQQILRQAKSQIEKLKQLQINFKVIILDIHTQFQPCPINNNPKQGDITCCLKKIPAFKTQIEEDLIQGQRFFIRVSFSAGSRQEATEYIEHRIESTLIERKNQNNHHIPTFFRPQNVFISLKIQNHLNTLQQTSLNLDENRLIREQEVAIEAAQQRDLEFTGFDFRPFSI